MKGSGRPPRGRGTNADRSGLTPRRSLSQNFLEDSHVLTRMAALIQKDAERAAALPVILEIGPGEGALTRYLLPFASVHAVEKDERAVALLRKTLAPASTAPGTTHESPRLQVTPGDIRQLELSDLVADAPSAKPLVVGNLPYAISSDILLWACQTASRIHSCHFLLQKEVVDRLVAPPGTKEYGRIGIFVALHFDTEVHFDVPPEAFYPPPKVTSTFFSLRPKNSCPLDQEGLALLERITAALFSQRRKKLRNALSHACEQLRLSDAALQPAVEVLARFSLTPDDRPERLPPEALVALTMAWLRPSP